MPITENDKAKMPRHAMQCEITFMASLINPNRSFSQICRSEAPFSFKLGVAEIVPCRLIETVLDPAQNMERKW
ncbi:hypothetical protein SUGI_0971220 [Cryptomeria japonica]|nr:hypothetical protein SUGI_0971220 [Cryptomeria japonica]